jgi:hypothetical protein
MNMHPLPRTRYREQVADTTRAVLDSPGTTSRDVRWAAFHRRLAELPPELRTFVDKVRLQAWRISDDDIAVLQAAGHDEDAIFEVTAAAALGAAIMRLERGLHLLHGDA